MKTSITTGQKKQYLRFVEDAADKALAEVGIDKDRLQKLIENGDEFQTRVIAGIKELSVNRFANEEIKVSQTYPKGYKVKGIAEQTNRLRELFPGIGFADEKLAARPLPQNAEGWFAIPRWQTLASTYGEAVGKVLVLISKTRKGKFNNFCEGKLGPQYLRQLAKTEKMLQKLGDEQKDYDILVVPAQFGIRHGGRTARRAREIMNSQEFGLDVFTIGIMLLTHPEREVQTEQLDVECAGSNLSPYGDGYFNYTPFFGFRDGEVIFGADRIGGADVGAGSASGFSE